VVSSRPAIAIEESFATIGTPATADPLKPLIALVGRVRVKVSTENGPIELGDYLTSSSVPGVAMKAAGAGKVIGMALESYNSEEIGLIRVFVDLGWKGNDLTVITDENGNIVEGDLQQSLANLGLFVDEYGVLTVEKLTAETARFEKMELVDKADGSIWCTWIENGEWQKVKGECRSQTSTSSPPVVNIYYYDGDGDGYGYYANFVETQTEGYVADSGDCDDLNPAVNPAAFEICDGLDNDCDGSVDEENVCGAIASPSEIPPVETTTPPI